MKLFTFLALLGMGLTQLTFSQEKAEAPRLNTMSYVFGVTTEAGITFGFTDYETKKINFTGKGSFEYYFPSTGNGNIGLRGFAQTGFISGDDKRHIEWQPTNTYSTKFNTFGGGIIYMVNFGEELYMWASTGAATMWFFPKDANGKDLPNYARGGYNNNMLNYTGDIALRLMLSERISINAGAGIIVPTNDYIDDMQYGSGDDMLLTGTFGISYFIGRDKDTDKDGVVDSKDACPGTPQGISVDETGCPLDADRDGVPDYKDKCPFTPEKMPVDANGCPLDADNDGVPDYKDKCQDTPSGVQVDANGCPLDADNDGVPDYKDKCSNTPANVPVDLNGCPLDADKDGVLDYKDKCPNTPYGVQVDSEGCPIKKEKEIVIIEAPAEITSLVLNGDTNFESNKTKLLSNAYPVLDSLSGTMTRHPEYKWEIGGYTDNVGSDKSNMKLSKLRAQAVVDYLISKGVKKSNLKIVGYGESNPITSNETVEGRSMNRRVEIKLLTKINK